MTLKQYMELEGLTAADVADRFGYSLSAVRKWMQGSRIPKLPTIKQIKRWSGNKVGFDDWS